MDNLGILVQAILSLKDTTSSKNQIAKELPKLESQLQSDKNTRVKIVAGLDVAKSKNLIQSQLNTLANQAKAPAIKIGIDTSGLNSVQGATQNITNGLKSVQTQAQQTASAVKQVGTSLLSLKAEQLRNITFDIGADDDGYFSFQKTLDNARKAINEIGKFKSISFDWNLDKDSGEIKNLTATITDSNNIVQNFTYNLEKLGQAFSYVGGSGNTNGVKKLLSDIEKANATAQKKLAEFNNKSMGLFNKTDVYAKALEASKNITDYDSIAKFNNAMAELEAHYQKITAYTRSGSKSLNPFINAVNDMAGMEEQIKRIKASADGLQNKSKSLIGNLGSLNRLADNVNKHAVGTEEWGQAYEKLKNKIAQVNDQIKTAKVEQKTTDSFAQKQQNMYSVIEQRMKQINQLKIQQLSTDESTSRIIQEQINSYTNQINGIKGNMSKYGYGDKTLDNEVEKLKVELDYKYRIAQSEKENRVQQQSNNELLKFQTDTLREINAEYEKIVANKRAMASTKSEENKSIYANRIVESEKIIANDMEMLKDANLLTEEINQQVASKRQYVSEQEKIIANTEQIKREQELNQVFKSQITEVEKYKNTINEIIGTLQNLQNSKTFTNNASNSQVTETRNKITTLIAEYQKLLTQLDGKVTPTTLENLNAELTQLNARFNDATTTAKRFETELKSDNGTEQLAQKVALLTQRIKAYRQANSKSEKLFGSQYDSMLSQLANPNIDLNTYNAINKQFQTMRQEINSANVAGKNLWQTLKEKAGKFVGWMSLTGIISSIWREMRQMVTNVVEIDKAMTNLKKVTDETDTTYAIFLKNANQQAKELHSTVTDLVEQVATWSKLGYSLSESQNLAKTSMIYSNVGEVDNTTAVSDLVTVMKAFNIESEKSIMIVDSLNELGNNFATSASDLGEGLTKSASALNAANNSFEQSIALLTGGTEITQNANEMGSALKVISMRIRGMKGELEDLGEEYDNIESISKIQTQILNLTSGKVNIFDDNGNFRSTYDILKDISEIYDKLSDPDKADLTEILFGKMRGNQGIAIIQAFQSGQIEKAYEAAKNSAGSAQEEFDRWSQSIEAHINTFKASFESLSQTILDSDLIKFVVDFGTTTLNTLDNIISKFGTIPTLLGSIATVGVFKNVGELLNTPVYVQPQLICA